ncbi:hypothetical protein D9613_004554 [Agrocybe pediades]|uniref:Uncharacterized protein n=1 Tax=Agrocybe pediades TaxID=84607 RepID=A0A8H4QHY2_9AGAR|nr:hypothetical protein D9613_004554 [Agrocybe pediades]
MSSDLYDHDERKQFRDPFLRHLAQSPTDILPSLCTPEFSFHVYDHIELPWKCITGIVAPLLAHEDDPRSRPLNIFKFNFDHRQIDLIHRSTRTRILALRQDGAEILYNEELIESSKMFRESVHKMLC